MKRSEVLKAIQKAEIGLHLIAGCEGKVLHDVGSASQMAADLREVRGIVATLMSEQDDNPYKQMSTERAERARGWRDQIQNAPRLRFKPEWEVSVIPPFSGADARFIVHKGDKRASVYLDLHNLLGMHDGPYWEVHPVGEGVGRCGMGQTDQLFSLICESLGETP